MLKHRVEHDGHVIEIRCSLWAGKETVLYDGRVVSQARNLFRFDTTHRFRAEEEEPGTQYELEYRFAIPRYRFRLLRDGGEVASGTVPGWTVVGLAIGLLSFAVGVVAGWYGMDFFFG